MRRSIQTIAILALLLGAPLVAVAQNAIVTGTLTDQSGAVLPGVTVTARNQETGLARAAVTSGEGTYRVPAPPPGIYTIAAELQGFAGESRPDIVLVIDQNAVINFTL